MWSIDEQSMLVLNSAEKLRPPYRSIGVILVSVFLKMSGMILSLLSRRFCLSLINLGQCRKKWFNISISKPQMQIGLTVSKRLYLNLCSFKWPTRRRVRKISLFGWLMLKTSILRGLVKFKIFFLNFEYEEELRIS